VYDTASDANLTGFRGAANATNLLDTIDNTPDVTIFVPINEAINSVGDSLSSLSEEDLANVLSYHLVTGTVGYSSTLENGTMLEASNGGNLQITIDENGTHYVNAARVVTPNVLVANGVVHLIDKYICTLLLVDDRDSHMFSVLNPNSTEVVR
jgi:uncharacterized surface protein with fasciclin (FAS1) repeats